MTNVKHYHLDEAEEARFTLKDHVDWLTRGFDLKEHLGLVGGLLATLVFVLVPLFLFLAWLFLEVSLSIPFIGKVYLVIFVLVVVGYLMSVFVYVVNEWSSSLTVFAERVASDRGKGSGPWAGLSVQAWKQIVKQQASREHRDQLYDKLGESYQQEKKRREDQLRSLMTTKTCGNCGRGVPSHKSKGDNCPHCGAYWGAERWQRTRF